MSRREGAVMGDVRIWDFACAVRRGREGEGVVDRRLVRRAGEGRGKEADVRACFSWVVRVRSIVSCGYRAVWKELDFMSS